MELYKSIVDPLSSFISESSFIEEIGNLHKYYFVNNTTYRNWSKFYFKINNEKDIDQIIKDKKIENLPFLPSSAFKHKNLANVSDNLIVKILTSSGTSSGSPSKIYLDKVTSDLMSERLRLDTNNSIGDYRRPLFVLDERTVFSNRKSFMARGAAIAGLLKYGQPINFLFDGNILESKALNALREYLNKGEVLLVGTTVNGWTLFIEQAMKEGLNLKNATLVHGGGWKKIERNGVDNDVFKRILLERLNLSRSINFFGMVEQLGSVSYECTQGKFHIPSCSRFIVRDPKTLEILEDGNVGLLQVNSILAYSYPGGSVLTDDLGSVQNSHNCSCGNKNPIFNFFGRQKFADTRGCGS